MNRGVGKLAWAVDAILFAICLLELGEGDFGSGAGLFIVCGVLSVALLKLKVRGFARGAIPPS